MDRRLEPWFRDRRWRVMTEKTGEADAGGVKIAFSEGAFEISPPGAFVTPLGIRGRKGLVVIETGDDGKDIPGTGMAFGEAALRRANANWGTVSGLPEEGS